MDNPLFTSALKFVIRRGLSVLGSAGMAVSDEWVAQSASLLLLMGNEAYQWWQSHKAEQHKAAGTFQVPPP